MNEEFLDGDSTEEVLKRRKAFESIFDGRVAQLVEQVNAKKLTL
jgi:hypothetical protein